MDIKGLEAIMQLHQELASRLPESVSGIAMPDREEPRLDEAEVKAMRAFLEQRLRVVSEAREGALARFDAELEGLKEAIAGTEPVKKPRPPRPDK